MRDYGKVYSRFWASRDVRALSERAKLLALYLLTSAHGTLAGVCYLPAGYVAEDMNWPVERVTEGFTELLAKGFATRCEVTNWVWVTKYLEWNPPENPNQLKAARRIVEQMPEECDWRLEFVAVFDSVVERFFTPKAQPSRKGSGTVSKSGTVTVAGTVSGSGTGTGTGTVDTDAVGSAAAGCVSGESGAGTAEQNGSAGNGHAEPGGFAAIQSIYPERVGDQRWTAAHACYTNNLKAGITAEQMIEGVNRYAKFCRAEEIVGTKYVKAAATFLGDDQGFLQAWTPSTKRKRETAADRWAREQEVNDASH